MGNKLASVINALVLEKLGDVGENRMVPAKKGDDGWNGEDWVEKKKIGEIIIK